MPSDKKYSLPTVNSLPTMHRRRRKIDQAQHPKTFLLCLGNACHIDGDDVEGPHVVAGRHHEGRHSTDGVFKLYTYTTLFSPPTPFSL